MGDLSTLVTDIGGAVSSLFNSKGAAAQANDYTDAATLATQNAQLSAASTRIQETQTARQVNQSIGTTQADIAGAGFTESGSGLDILRASANQGALAKALVNIQGAINENSYAAQAGAYSGEAKAADEASAAGTVGAIASIGGALLSGSSQLISAGKTVVQGYNTITGMLTGSTTSADTAAAQITGQTASDVATGGEDLGTNDPGLLNLINGGDTTAASSATDTAINSGAILNDTSTLAADTTQTAADTAIDSADEAFLSDAASSAADAGLEDAAASAAGDAIPVAGEVLLAAQATQALGIGGTVGGIADDISNAASTVVGGVVNAVSSVGSAIGGIFGSVICTALYERGMVSKEVWHSATLYGLSRPSRVRAGYLYWAQPVARGIRNSETFALLMAKTFAPVMHQEAAMMGQKKATRSWYGFCALKVFYAFSWCVGQFVYKGECYVKA